ncbi:hypothetical protein DFH27DRAFT_559147 [Peziza echinospora]|nr:hypothetical protein DFH27DRAFT_559147 [Peziza echinospora]
MTQLRRYHFEEFSECGMRITMMPSLPLQLSQFFLELHMNLSVGSYLQTFWSRLWLLLVTTPNQYVVLAQLDSRLQLGGRRSKEGDEGIRCSTRTFSPWLAGRLASSSAASSTCPRDVAEFLAGAKLGDGAMEGLLPSSNSNSSNSKLTFFDYVSADPQALLRQLIEVGYSEPLRMLRMDAKWWLHLAASQ